MRAAEISQARYTYLRVRDVAAVLQMSEAQVRALLPDSFTFPGTPPPVAISKPDAKCKAWRVPQEALDKFLGRETPKQ